MSLFSKASSSDPDRRLADEPLDGNYGRTLPLLQRVFIRVLVSEMRKMLDERDAEREARATEDRERVIRREYADGSPSAQRAEIDRGER